MNAHNKGAVDQRLTLSHPCYRKGRESSVEGVVAVRKLGAELDNQAEARVYGRFRA